MQLLLALSYLCVIALANVLIAWLGPNWSPLIGFLCIGFDITARDRLHERLSKKWRTIALISLLWGGGILSYILAPKSGQIAIASAYAFIIAFTLDSLVYQVSREHGKSVLQASDRSNIASALADSIIFPALAFGAFMPVIVLAQFVSKLIGSYFWARVLLK